MSLHELENFIKAKKHLPHFPSVKEMEKNGIEAGETSMQLLQTVEELTLYIIEQNKRIEVLEKKIDGRK